MNVLILDTDATGLDLAYRAAEAGHAVRWWVPPHKDGSKARDGEGFTGIEKVSAWKPHMAWAKSGIIINLFNDQKLTTELDRWRSFGMPIFGPTVKSANLEWNRGDGMNFMEQHGIEVPEYTEFKNFDEALKFAWKAQDPFVFKPMGDEEDKSLTYVASDPADLVGWMMMKKSNGLKMKGSCILQKKIDLIAEMGVSAWVGKNGFLPGKFNLNFEFKKLMNQDYGPATGEMGSICRYVDDDKLAREVLIPFEESMVKLGHIGDFDIGCGIDKHGKAWPMEFSNRFGWPSTQILMACHESDPVEWMRDAVVSGKDTLQVDDRMSIGIVMARPPFPNKNDDPQSSVGYPISGLEDVWDHVSPWQMMLEDGPVMEGGKMITTQPIYKTTGEYVCVVTAKGSDVHDVVAEVYETVDRIKFADRMVRTDVGAKLEKQLPKLHSLGYAVDMEY